jgi:hypothetical protein
MESILVMNYRPVRASMHPISGLAVLASETEQLPDLPGFRLAIRVEASQT